MSALVQPVVDRSAEITELNYRFLKEYLGATVWVLLSLVPLRVAKRLCVFCLGNTAIDGRALRHLLLLARGVT